jgi:poly-gamma-glutamate capsule biosynthesis protein CapA/YwtB (metallophosphatase superfamily)
MVPDKISVYAVGDIIPEWPNPESIVELALPTLRQADILFGQLEIALSLKVETQVSALGYSRRPCDPKKVSVLTHAGFDLISWASNHALDWGETAFLETIDTLTKNNIAVIGVGRNIDEARKPLILERKRTKVAFLAYCSVLPKGYDARADKLGCAPMRASTFYEQWDWQPGTSPRIITLADKDDLAAMVDDIKKVRPLADVVIMSIHWGVHTVPAIIAMYQKEVGHAAIDAGVDLILGHHPHILKGIEVYKGKVIFYSLCNFVGSNPKARPEAIKNEARMLYKVKEDPEYALYPYPADSRKTIIAKCIISDKKIEGISFLPVLFNKQAQPEVMRRQDKGFYEVLNYIDEISKDQGIETKFSVEGDEVVICT